MEAPLKKLRANRWVLTEDWVIDGHIIPAGFETDLASIPFPLNLLYSKDEKRKYNQAAILHDYLIKQKGDYFGDQFAFRRAMLVLGEDKATANGMFIGVLFFCWFFQNLKDQ
jgi:endo-beta-N-acetylglucosaminidase D